MRYLNLYWKLSFDLLVQVAGSTWTLLYQLVFLTRHILLAHTSLQHSSYQHHLVHTRIQIGITQSLAISPLFLRTPSAFSSWVSLKTSSCKNLFSSCTVLTPKAWGALVSETSLASLTILLLAVTLSCGRTNSFFIHFCSLLTTYKVCGMSLSKSKPSSSPNPR